jgi:streptogramin lyase
VFSSWRDTLAISDVSLSKSIQNEFSFYCEVGIWKGLVTRTYIMMIEPNQSRVRRAFRWLVGSREKHVGRQKGRRFQLEPLESRRLLTSISDFSIPTAVSSPAAITTGPDGNLWFTENNANTIGTINPTTHAISQFTVSNAGSAPDGIVTGPDGSLWFTDDGTNSIGKINPTTHAITEFAVPTADSIPLAITNGPNGEIWFTEQNAGKIGEINVTTHAITEFAIPTSGSKPTGITVGPNGNLWFTEETTNKIGEINPTTGAISEFTITGSATPLQITTGSDGSLWFTDFASNEIWRYTPSTGAFSNFLVPTANSGPVGITAGPDGNIYFTEQSSDQIGMIDPTSSQFSGYTVPTAGAQPYAITAGPNGTIWFTEFASSKVGVLTLDTHLAVTSQPPGTLSAGAGFGLTVSDVYDSGVVDQSGTGSVAITLASNPGSTALGGTLTATLANGVATFSGLTLTKAGNGYSVSATSDGLASASSNTFNVTAAAPSQLAIIAQPPGSITQGNGISFQVGAFDQFGNLATSFSGTVTIALASGPGGSTLGGSLTATASQGVATFSGLSLNNAGGGYSITVVSWGLKGTRTNSFQVTAPPTIVSQQVVMERKTNKKGKPVGKATLVGFQLDFSVAMNPGTAGNSGNYQLNLITTKKVKRKIVQVLKPIQFQASYNATNNSVGIMLIGKQTFPKGGQLTVFGGVTSAAGVAVDGNNEGIAGDSGVFTILANAKGIART